MNAKCFRAVWRFALGALSFVATLATLQAASDVSGRIMTSTGSPIEGGTVFVYTAAPKSGIGALCPSCYPDCGKKSRADAAGRFKLAGLSSQLVFRLLVVAKDHAPTFVPRIEAGGPPLDVVLAPRKNLHAPPDQTARGRVVDSLGAPIAGAVLEISGVAFDDGRQQFGGLREVDPIVVTDEKGEFVLTSGTPLEAFIGRVSARAFANRAVHLDAGKTHTLALAEGATLSGRVMRDGQPVAGVTLGLTPQNRSAESFVGNFEVGTDADGRFTFTNLPPRTDYNVYGKMDTIGRHGAIAIRPVHVGRHGTRTEIGDLPIERAFRLRGRAALADGGRLPDQSRILLARDRSSDLLAVDLGADGEFDVQGVPPGVVTLSARIPGYQVSPRNRSYEASNHRLIGRVDADISGMILLLEKRNPAEGPILARTLSIPAEQRPREFPLRGTEAP